MIKQRSVVSAVMKIRGSAAPRGAGGKPLHLDISGCQERFPEGSVGRRDVEDRVISLREQKVQPFQAEHLEKLVVGLELIVRGLVARDNLGEAGWQRRLLEIPEAVWGAGLHAEVFLKQQEF